MPTNAKFPFPLPQLLFFNLLTPLCENPVQVLILADLHRVAQLKQAAMSHVRQCRQTLFKAPDWATRIKNYPDLMAEVLETVTQ